MPYRPRQKVIFVTPTPDLLVVAFKPPVGLSWELVALQCYHNDTTSRAMLWRYQDGVNTNAFSGSGDVAAGVRWYFPYGNSLISGRYPVLEAESCWIEAVVAALTAGKSMTIVGTVIETDLTKV